MPATSGSAICSSASRPRRRVTKLARLSSPLAVRRGRTRSRAIRSFPRQEKSGEVTKGPSRAGARRRKPSGRGGSRPRRTAEGRRGGGVGGVGGEGEGGGGEGGGGARRGEEEEALRQGVEPAAADDVGPAGAV